MDAWSGAGKQTDSATRLDRRNLDGLGDLELHVGQVLVVVPQVLVSLVAPAEQLAHASGADELGNATE